VADTAQVVFVAFGGEEPRGPGDLHHFGSKDYVAELTEDEGYDLRGMVALDRVGVGRTVPLSSVDGTPAALRDQLAGVAEELHVPHVEGTDAASDHESFADAGYLAARIGSTPYAGYHSADDVPAVVRPDQLGRVGRILTSWLRGR
jgi:Zn-dependent M28 family amino/carboxypeptidase